MSVESHLDVVLSSLQEDTRTLVKAVTESRWKTLDPKSEFYQGRTVEEYLHCVTSDSKRSWAWFTFEMFKGVSAAAKNINDFLTQAKINDKKVKVFHTDLEDEASTVVSAYFQTLYNDWLTEARKIWEEADMFFFGEDLIERKMSESQDRLSSVVFNGWAALRGKLEAQWFLCNRDLCKKMRCLLEDALPSVLEEKVNLTMDVLQASLAQFNSEMEVKLPALCQEVLGPRCQTMRFVQKQTMLDDTVSFCVDLQQQKYTTAVSEAMENVLKYFTGDFSSKSDDLSIDERLETWRRPEIGDIVGCFEKLLKELRCKLQQFRTCVQRIITEFFVLIHNTNSTFTSLHLTSYFEVLDPSTILNETRSQLCELAHA